MLEPFIPTATSPHKDLCLTKIDLFYNIVPNINLINIIVFTIKRFLISLCALGSFAMSANAQLSTNEYKFLGNITTRNSVNGGGGAEYSTLWNQLTPENETKWSSIEGTHNQFNWTGSDAAYKYCKDHNIPFKFHCLIWGSQYPTWMDRLSKEEQYKEIVEWLDAIKNRYPDLKMIDVVNEAVPGHAPAPYKEALGGDGKTGYDWIIKSFEMAYERWPDAILIYNDYNTFQWQKTQFIDLVKTLRNAGAPIDAYGCQSHDLTDIAAANFKSAMKEIQDSLKMPMYSTEYDIGTTDDAAQKKQYSDQIPYMWEADYCGGITLWGYIYGSTWTTDGNSGIIRNGADRPAMTWLREYMNTDAAKKAIGPFPGGIKTHEIYIKPSASVIKIGEEASIALSARILSDTISIDSIDLYLNDKLAITFKESPYTYAYTPSASGTVKLKAVMYDDKGNKYERLGGFYVVPQRTPFDGVIAIPGTIEAENFDICGDGISYHDSDSKNEGDASSYRPDGGIDIVNGNGGKAIGYTNSGEWMEYTIDVKDAGIYEYEVIVSSGVTSSSFSIGIDDGNGLVDMTGSLNVPCIAQNDWNQYCSIKGSFSKSLNAGQQIVRITINSSNCNIDKVKLSKEKINSDIKLSISANPSPVIIGNSTQLTVTTETPDSVIKAMEIFANGMLLETLTQSPYEISYTPSITGTIIIQAVAIDTADAKSVIHSYNLSVYRTRSPYSKAIVIPGTIHAENFDRGQDGLTYHDSDAKDEGNVGYRNDNEGVDIINGNNGKAIGYTQVDEWLEYTINVRTAGLYSYTAYVSSELDGSGFKLSLMNDDGSATTLADVSVPNTSSFDTYKTVTGNISSPLVKGEQILRLIITGAYCNIDKIGLKCTYPDGVEDIIYLKDVVYDVYTVLGVHIGKIQGGGDLSQRLHDLTGRRGVYILRDITSGQSKKVSIK